MRFSLLSYFGPCLALLFRIGDAIPASTQTPLSASTSLRNVSTELFAELEELARLVDISYCVGTTGIQKPFACASRCAEFKGFGLVKVGALLPRTETEDRSNVSICIVDMEHRTSAI